MPVSCDTPARRPAHCRLPSPPWATTRADSTAFGPTSRWRPSSSSVPPAPRRGRTTWERGKVPTTSTSSTPAAARRPSRSPRTPAPGPARHPRCWAGNARPGRTRAGGRGPSASANSRDIPRLRALYQRAITACEAHGVTTVAGLPDDVLARDPELRWVASTSTSTVIGRRTASGNGRPPGGVVVLPTPEAASTDTDLAGLPCAVTELLMVPHVARRAAKVAAVPRVDERHLFVGIGDGGLPDEPLPRAGSSGRRAAHRRPGGTRRDCRTCG